MIFTSQSSSYWAEARFKLILGLAVGTAAGFLFEHSWPALIIWVHPHTHLAPYFALPIIAAVSIVFGSSVDGYLTALGRTKRIWAQDYAVFFFFVIVHTSHYLIRPSDYTHLHLHLFASLIPTSYLLVRFVYSQLQDSPPNYTQATIRDLVLFNCSESPLNDYSKTPIDHSSVVETIESLISTKHARGHTIGVTGPWGIGKSSILSVLRDQLKARGFIVCYVSSWDYRNADNILHGIFNELQNTLGSWIHIPRLHTYVSKLLNQLLKSNTKGLLEFLPVLRVDSTEDLAESIDAAISGLERPVVLIIDDLDRLDPEELRVALRAINHLNRLESIDRIIAYDRDKVRGLAGGDKGREDYHLKVIPLEIPVPSPTPKDLLSLLDACLKPLFESLDESDSSRFQRLWARQDSTTLTNLVATPRDIKRVCAQVAIAWEKLKGDVNVNDLLLLSAIQAVAPNIHRALQTHRELFLDASWSGDINRAMRPEDDASERQKYINNLTASHPLVLPALFALFPHFEAANEGRKIGLDITSARDNRRIYVPEIFDRYFSFYIREGLVPQTLLDQDASEILRITSQANRINYVQALVRKYAKRNAIDSFLDNWEVFIEALTVDGAVSDDVIEAVVVGMAQASEDIPSTGHSFSLSAHNRAGLLAINLASKLKTKPSLHKTLSLAIQESSSIGFCDAFVFYACNPERGKEVYKDILPDCLVMQTAFKHRVAHKYEANPHSFFGARHEEQVAIFYRLADLSLLRKILTNGLRANPAAIIDLIALMATFDYSPKTGLRVVSSNYTRITEVFERTYILEHIQNAASHLSLVRDKEILKSFELSISKLPS